MKTVRVRDVVIGEGMPKVCVPIVEIKLKDAVTFAETLKAGGADIAEWRIDWFDEAYEISKVVEAAGCIRKALKEIPLIATFRTAKEGGEKEIKVEQYIDLNLALIRSGYVDVIDVELFFDEKAAKILVEEAHRLGVCVIASNHDFQKTPEKEELFRRVKLMIELGADIPKIAVMPQNVEDVMVLLTATYEMSRFISDRPVITMSMSKEGVISRFSGEFFGSALTFAAVGKESAPGQVEAGSLKKILSQIHDIIS